MLIPKQLRWPIRLMYALTAALNLRNGWAYESFFSLVLGLGVCVAYYLLEETWSIEDKIKSKVSDE